MYVYGKLFCRIWRDAQNTPNVGLNVLADIVELCGSKSDTTTAAPAPAAAPGAQSSAASPAKNNANALPF